MQKTGEQFFKKNPSIIVIKKDQIFGKNGAYM